MHERRPPDILALLSALESHAVRYVITGSFAAKLTVPRREKDVPRVAALREIQRARALSK
jgi:hypothetical protein